MSITASASLALSSLFSMTPRMSGTPLTLDMSATVPSGITNVPELSPMPAICFMKDSKEAFMLLIVSWAHSSHSHLCFCSKWAAMRRLLETQLSQIKQAIFFPLGFVFSSMNCLILSCSSVQGSTSCIMESTIPPSPIISLTIMFMTWSMSTSSKSTSPDLSYFSLFWSSDSTEKASAIRWNFGLASGSPRFLSGWYLRESFLYAFLMSSALAPLGTPRILYRSFSVSRSTSSSATASGISMAPRRGPGGPGQAGRGRRGGAAEPKRA
mmetsp:Transcript_76404/g.216036  ORF Transcript_76404/g.216036 Transcript_76404/m.216036 type:complete len:268 (-) Transcript_76404:7-810(-)